MLIFDYRKISHLICISGDEIYNIWYCVIRVSIIKSQSFLNTIISFFVLQISRQAWGQKKKVNTIPIPKKNVCSNGVGKAKMICFSEDGEPEVAATATATTTATDTQKRRKSALTKEAIIKLLRG